MLKFERIELIGFKSFADKAKIDLIDGITAIVGPNGCGKSNVADAIKWVLGEQSAKTLRGTSMQDVIFSGTTERKSLSYCEVSLYFNNSEEHKLFPSLEYGEVVITRKLFRSGESEYMINRQPSRLKDIVQILHECGVSKNGYSVIEQGKVSEIFNSKPEDRRAIFEEAVGIAKTKQDRKESIAKLDRTNENISRVNDILYERERQLGPLSRQADKARAYRKLSDNLKYQEINTYIYKYDNASSTKDAINQRINGYKEAIDVARKNLDESIESYNNHQREIADVDIKIDKLSDEITEKAVANEQKTGEGKVFEERINYFKNQICDRQDQINAGKRNIEQDNNDIECKNDYISRCEKDIKNLNEDRKKIQKEISNLDKEISLKETSQDDVRDTVIKSAESLADVSKNIGSLTTQESILSSQHSEVLSKVQGLVDKYNSLKDTFDSNSDRLKNVEQFIGESKAQVKELEDTISSTNEFISKINNDLFKQNNLLSSEITKLKFQESIRDNFEGFSNAVKNILTACKTNKELDKRVKGVVGNILTTDKEYEVAVETALGGTLQNIITENTQDAEYVINFLKQTNGGRTTCLPISSIRYREDNPDIYKAAKEYGAVGIATKLVKFDSYFEKIVKFVLGNTLIANDISVARKIAEKYSFSFKIVTLDGDIVAQNGSMSGGSRKHGNDASVLAVERKVQETQDNVNKIQAEIDRLEKNKENLTRDVNEQVDKLDELNKNLDSAKQECVSLQEKVKAGQESLDATEKDIQSNNDTISLIVTRLDEVKTEYTSTIQGNDELIRQKEEAASKEKEGKEYNKKLRDERDSKIQDCNEIDTKIAQLNSYIESSKNEILRLKNDIVDIQNKEANHIKVIESDNNIIEKIKIQMEQVTLTPEELDALNKLRAKKEEIAKRKETLNGLIEKDNVRRDAFQADIDKNTEKKGAEEINLANVDSELQYMSEKVFTDYELTYETCVPLKDAEYDIANSKNKIEEINEQIKKLGSINHEAINEYEELNLAYNELLEQKNDLVQAQEDLRKVITDLTNDMALTFNEGFEKIRVNFSKIFKELFGGGKADLIVEESQTGDPLDAGIEIIAEPPGKKLQRISLLSGGEKSLTAIAILFSILKLRPMPFCVLDEIEAALDDANVDRFANYLKNFSLETQFICITHKKVTMEHADGLFGITMPEKGVSSVISVRLADAVKIEGVD